MAAPQPPADPDPARPPAPYAQAALLLQRRGLSQKTIAIATGCLLFLGLIAFGKLWDRYVAPKMDATITSCEFTDTDHSATVGLTVTNNGNRTGHVFVTIEYLAGDNAPIGTDTVYVADVRPGDTVRTEETTILDARPGPFSKCLIVYVDDRGIYVDVSPHPHVKVSAAR